MLAGLGVYIIVEARGWEYLGSDGPGPGFFPLWYGIAMAALSMLLVATTFAGRSAGPGQAVNWREVGRAMLAWGALALCVGLLKVLGFLAAFGLFTRFHFLGEQFPLPRPELSAKFRQFTRCNLHQVDLDEFHDGQQRRDW